MDKHKPSDYLDNDTIDAIKKSIVFLRDSGLYTDPQIFDKIKKDFDVSLRAIQEVSGQLPVSSSSGTITPKIGTTGAFAYVLIICDTGYENEIISKLISLESVTEVQGVFGEYDIFVKLDASSEKQIAKAIGQIRGIPHIRSTNTLSSIPSQGGFKVDSKGN